jgi:hypothetical protein
MVMHAWVAASIRQSRVTEAAESSQREPIKNHGDQPNTKAPAPPTTPFPVPGPPVAKAKTIPPLTAAMRPVTRAKIAPGRPQAVPQRLEARAGTSPPMTTPTSASAATVVAQSRRGVRP